MTSQGGKNAAEKKSCAGLTFHRVIETKKLPSQRNVYLIRSSAPLKNNELRGVLLVTMWFSGVLYDIFNVKYVSWLEKD